MIARRWLVSLIAVLALLAGAPGAAFAQEDEGRGGDNAAIAVNTRDGSSIFRLAFEVRRTMSDVVDNQNAAVAYASCEECRTVAVAIQVVLVMGDAEQVTPENFAIAINEECTLCETMAFAYQIVLGTDGPVRLTGEGRRQIAELRREARRLGREELDAFEMDRRLDDIVARLRDVLREELRAIRPGDEDDDDREEEDSDRDRGEEEGEPEPAAPPAGSQGEEVGGETEPTQPEEPPATEPPAGSTP